MFEIVLDLFSGVKFTDIFSAISTIIATISLFVSLHKNRCSIDVVVRDLYRDNGTSYIELDIINKSDLPITVYDVFVMQYKKNFRLDHVSRKVMKDISFDHNGETKYKSFETTGLPIVIGGFDYAHGIYAALPSERGPFTGDSLFRINSNRGSKKKRKRIEKTGTIEAQFKFNS